MKQNYFEQESGRSMVEMLGVLAIIGVLSVGGISGYTTAMNKHKANEILNAAAVRAMAVSTQLQSGAETPSLGEFDSNEKIGGATFTGVDKVGDNQFKLTFGDKPTDAVLTQMKNIAGDNVGVDGSRLLYNNDLSSGVDGKNTNVESVDGDVYTCKNGFDPSSKCEDCPSGKVNQGGECTTCSDNQIIQNGACVSCPGGSTTTTSDNEVTGYTGCYCASNETWDGTEKTCKSTGPTCTGNEHEVEYGGSKHCVEIVLGSFDHAQAYNKCLDATTGRHLMEKSEFESAFTADSGDYSADLTTKIGWEPYAYFMWLGTCYNTTCQAAGYLNDDGTMEDVDSNAPGSAWDVSGLGDVGFYGRYSHRYALCVR